MSDFGPNAGIEYVERMSGHVAGGISDPLVAASVASEGGRTFTLDLRISIPHLHGFLEAEKHVAQIADGTVSWLPGLPSTPVLPGGQITLFRRATGDPVHRFIDFAFSFHDGERVIDCTGLQDLHDDNGVDAATDLSTLNLTLLAGSEVAGTGIVQASLLDLIRQVQSCKVTGAHSEDEESSARKAYLGFLNSELREIYPNLPLLFQDRARLSLEQRKTLNLCARLLLPSQLPAGGPQFDDILKGLDTYLENASASQLATITEWLQVIGTFLPGGDGGNLTLLRMLVTAELNRTDRSPIRDILQLIHTLVVFPYYAHPKADGIVGYVRPKHVLPPSPSVDLPVAFEPPDRVFDFVIAGSGPAGTLLAQRLAATGKSVLLLEAGPYVPERTIDPDEIRWTARLFKDSALQQANAGSPLFGVQGPSFMVLQGACVGGGGLINNAVCFRLPAQTLARWQSVGFPVSAADLSAAYSQVAADLGIKPASEAAQASIQPPPLNPTWKFLKAKLGEPHKPPISDPPQPGLYECLVNLRDCIGTGLCNVGCGSERKRNGVQVYLHQAVANDCTIVDRAELRDIHLAPGGGNGPRRVESVTVRLRDGREVAVKGKEFILSCGPVGSSIALLRSDDLREHIDANQIPVGRRFSANLGSPLFAFCRERVNEKPGLQIAHYYCSPPDDGFVIETWFNPPGANAMAMPGFQQTHFDRMMAYASTVAAAPLVGSEATGTVSLDWQDKPSIEFPVSGKEIGRLRNGLVLLAGAFLDGGSGSVDYVLAGLGNGRKLKTAADIHQFDQDLQRIQNDPSKMHLLKIGTGHPQGGNAISSDPHIAVVDDQFRLRGIANLRICDGSVFPASAGVNPQWTIMALAHECARILTH
jgi:choline dehydrogenase-like flavoprotein